MLLAVGQEFGLEVGKEVIPQIASGFAGGIGNSGAVCGAVAGGVMALGLKLGRADTIEGMLKNLAVVREFRQRFEAEMGHVDCRDLTGLDLSSVESLEELTISDVPQKVCFPAVGAAYRLAVEILRDTE